MPRTDWNRPASFFPPGEGERRIKLVLSYDGSFYHGWQSQDDGVSIQERLETELEAVVGHKVRIFGSGRTDAGVHALMQTAHFDTSSRIDPEKFRVILNTRLEKHIRILSSSDAGPGFHARFSTQSREYWYLVKDELHFLPFDAGHVAQVRVLPSVGLLDSYAACIVGTHDFTTFCSARDKSLSRFRDIYLSQWDTVADVYGNPMLRYRVAGNAFLYHQVRSMVGTMLEFASRSVPSSVFGQALEARDRSLAGKTAPPDGLYLADISYDKMKYEWFERQWTKEGRT